MKPVSIGLGWFRFPVLFIIPFFLVGRLYSVFICFPLFEISLDHPHEA